MKSTTKTSMLAAAMMAMAPGTEAAGFFASSSARNPQQPKEFTVFDQGRLDKAQAKHERKAAKRLGDASK